MRPIKSENGVYAAFVADGHERTIYYVFNDDGFEPVASLPESTPEENVKQFINLLEQAYSTGYDRSYEQNGSKFPE